MKTFTSLECVTDFPDDQIEDGSRIVQPGGRAVACAVSDLLKDAGIITTIPELDYEHGWEFDAAQNGSYAASAAGRGSGLPSRGLHPFGESETGNCDLRRRTPRRGRLRSTPQTPGRAATRCRQRKGRRASRTRPRPRLSRSRSATPQFPRCAARAAWPVR